MMNDFSVLSLAPDEISYVVRASWMTRSVSGVATMARVTVRLVAYAVVFLAV